MAIRDQTRSDSGILARLSREDVEKTLFTIAALGLLWAYCSPVANVQVSTAFKGMIFRGISVLMPREDSRWNVTFCDNPDWSRREIFPRSRTTLDCSSHEDR